MAADVNSRLTSEKQNSVCSDSGNVLAATSETCGTPNAHLDQDMSFREYSPQNNQIIAALTGTPNVNNNIDNVNTSMYDYSDLPSSQEFVPNQDFIVNLDNNLNDLPMDTYISKLIDYSNNCENTVTWYRTILASRAKSYEGCPQGKLVTRKSTHKSASIHKHARDCYLLYMFMNGDNTCINEVFRKDDLKASTSETPSQYDKSISIDTRVTLQSALQRLCALENSEKENKKRIHSLQNENEKIKIELASVKDELKQHGDLRDRKHTQYDASIKLLNQQSKSVGDFSVDSYRATVTKIEHEIQRHNKLFVNVQKNINEIKTTNQQTYASVASPNCTPQHNKVNSINDETEKLNTPVNPNTHSYENTNGSPVRLTQRPERSPNVMKDDISVHDNNNRSISNDNDIHVHEFSKTVTNRDSSEEKEMTFRIPVRTDGITPSIQHTDEEFFTGVSRKKTARFYMSGINAKSTRNGIWSYLTKRGVHVTYLRLFNTKNNARVISAKLNVSTSSADLVESSDFWPKGVHCREWLSNREWYRSDATSSGP